MNDREAMQALLAGKKLMDINLSPDEYCHLVDDMFVDEVGRLHSFQGGAAWQLYQTKKEMNNELAQKLESLERQIEAIKLGNPSIRIAALFSALDSDQRNKALLVAHELGGSF